MRAHAGQPEFLISPALGRSATLSAPNRVSAMETTLVLCKPDALQRGLVGRILSRFEEKGLQLVGLKLMTMSRELAARHYAEHHGKGFYDGLVGFMTASPLVAVAVRGPQAVAVVRKLMGKTFGLEAEPGTLRGDFGCSKSFNLLHVSDAVESAARELALFFPEGVASWSPISASWLWDAPGAA